MIPALVLHLRTYPIEMADPNISPAWMMQSGSSLFGRSVMIGLQTLKLRSPNRSPAQQGRYGKEDQGSGRMASFFARGQKRRRSKVRFAPAWGDMNFRHLAPKEVLSIFCSCLQRFIALSTQKQLLFNSLISTVSVYSAAVCGLTCGQRALLDQVQ